MNKVLLFMVIALIGVAGCEKIGDLLETEQKVDLCEILGIVTIFSIPRISPIVPYGECIRFGLRI